MQCGNQVPLNTTDIVGQGYRCTPCSQRAEVAVLQGATDNSHMSSSSLNRSRGSATGAIAGGAAMLGLGVVLMGATDGEVGKFFALGGVISLIGGLIRNSR